MIREANKNDIPFLASIEKACFKDPWPLSQFTYEMEENPFAKLFVVVEEGNIIGFFDLWILYENAQIANIAIDQGHRRKGLGKTCMQYMEDLAIAQQCEFITLEVRVSNRSAQQLYTSCGYTRLGNRKNYYADGEDALLLGKAIGGLL